MAKRKYKKQKRVQKQKINKDTAVIILIVLGILSAVLIYFKSGYVGQYLSNLLGGLFGIIKYIIPIGILAIAAKIMRNDKDYITSKLIQYGIVICCLCTVLTIYEVTVAKSIAMTEEFQNIVERANYLGTINKGRRHYWCNNCTSVNKVIRNSWNCYFDHRTCTDFYCLYIWNKANGNYTKYY